MKKITIYTNDECFNSDLGNVEKSYDAYKKGVLKELKRSYGDYEIEVSESGDAEKSITIEDNNLSPQEVYEMGFEIQCLLESVWEEGMFWG